MKVGYGSMNIRATDSSDRGQMIVVFALALVALVAMVGLVIEAGNVFAQQRIAQNGSDSAATAGTLIVAEKLAGKTRTDQDVYNAVNSSATANALTPWTAEYTDDQGQPIGANVQNVAQAIPTAARGVQVHGNRVTNTTFGHVIGLNTLTATADATVVAGELSTECVADDDGCTLLPVAFPVKTFECDGNGNLLNGQWIGAPPPGHEGEGYWPTVGSESLPGGNFGTTGDTSKMAILPLCRGASDAGGAFGWLDLVAGQNLAQEITGPLNNTFDVPNWYQTQPGNANSVEDELMLWWHKPVLIPLYNAICDVDPGATSGVCPAGHNNKDPDPNGNNTWYYVHTLGVFYIDQVLVQGSNVAQCASPPGSPLVPVTNGTGFLGCLKGWFVNYVTSGPIVPGGCPPTAETCGNKPIGIQLIR
jgi:Flp pilus assembly protein TadG